MRDIVESLTQCAVDCHELLLDAAEEIEKHKTMMNRHEVACILAEATGTNCACDMTGIDEWLPEKCDFGKCWPVVGVACWEQYLKHRNENDPPKGEEE